MNLPPLRNQAQLGFLVEVWGFGLGGAEVPVSVDTTCEEVVHHALFDRLVFGDQGFRRMDQVVQRRQYPGDLALLRLRGQCDRDSGQYGSIEARHSRSDRMIQNPLTLLP